MSNELSCLWIAREIPFPRNTGDRIYSSKLAEAFAGAGVSVTYLGLKTGAGADPESELVKWIGVPGKKKSNWIAALSRYPLVAAAHATAPLRRMLKLELAQKWDLIVLDHYGSAWALPHILKHGLAVDKKLLLIHVSHNHEENLALALSRSNPRFTLRGLALFLNFIKIRYWERRLTRLPHLVSAITDEDREVYSRRSKSPLFLTLTPGYSGSEALPRRIDEQTPRSVVIVGSYRWGVKEQNLRSLILEADRVFFYRGITLHVVGDVTESLVEEFRGKLLSTIFHGFVPDFTPYLAGSRIALVPEVIGGGFKLKFLDYIFARVPVATIDDASAGLPREIRQHVLLCKDMRSLVECVGQNIDDFPVLNSLQEGAFKAASNQFSWLDRGSMLLRAVNRIRTNQ